MIAAPHSEFFGVAPGERLHLRVFPAAGPPALLLHGAIENGRIFYSDSGRGWAPFLQAAGYHVYAVDLRGRGLSEPTGGRHSEHGQLEVITEDLPALAEHIGQRHRDVPQLWCGHSWGGVLMMSALARHDGLAERVGACVHFGSKRSVSVVNWDRIISLNIGWHVVAPLAVAIAGYLPAKKLRMGSDIETRRSLAASRAWVRMGPWIDPDDGFDYRAAMANRSLPPCLFVGGAADPVLGHRIDILRFMAECGLDESLFRFLSRAGGDRHDYDHINQLTHPDAPADHFPGLVAWINAQFAQRE